MIELSMGPEGWGVFEQKNFDLYETPPPLQGEGEGWFLNEHIATTIPNIIQMNYIVADKVRLQTFKMPVNLKKVGIQKSENKSKPELSILLFICVML